MDRSRGGKRFVAVSVLALLLVGALASSAWAHVETESGPFRVEMGWGNEPPLTGLDNFVEVNVSNASGAPVAVPTGALSVEVTYGSAAETLSLVPGAGPGEVVAELVPTRPGTYAFRVTGTLQGRSLEVSSTCSETTFECVESSSGAEFPAKDPSGGELAQRLTRESARAEEATDKAESAQRTAIVALALAALAVAVALGLVVRERWRSSRS
ncbi:MAG: hypothetical protein WD827_05105 [Solirubrobacterales bacterium]